MRITATPHESTGTQSYGSKAHSIGRYDSRAALNQKL
jgi:hypothetical protein